MATQPFEKLLNRDFAKVAAKDVIEIASPLLKELLNHATQAFQRCQVSLDRLEDSGEADVGQHLAPFMLYQHLIEMTDGVEVLISNSCSGPTLPLLRSTLEALLSLEYMLKEDYKIRSLSWFCLYVHERIEAYELLDPATSRGQKFKTTLEREGDTIVPNPGLSQNADKLRRMLGNELSSIETEYQNQKKRKPNWYSLFKGPANVRELAVHLNKLRYYDTLYSRWSSTMHATDASRFLTRTSGGKAGFHPLRYPASLKDYAWLSATFMVLATGLMVQKFRPGEDLSRWYKEEVQEKLDYLRQVKIKMNTIKT
jgi:hypothetical protein